MPPAARVSSTGAFPKLVAFDLDYTLWDLWIDTHVSAPFTRPDPPNDLNLVHSRRGPSISFYPDVPGILHLLRQHEGHTTVAACSRTSAPEYAREVLGLLLMPPPEGKEQEAPKRAIEFFDEKEIYPGSKLKHFRAIHKRTGIPYDEMLFFDDESRNKEVESLGVTMILVDSRGTTRELFEAGLKRWRKEKGK